jgi:hypothetical protein
MSSLVAYVPVVGSMLLFFGAMLFQARPHHHGSPLRSRASESPSEVREH